MCRGKYCTFTPRIWSSWFSRNIKSLQQNSSFLVSGAWQALEAFGHERHMWCLIRTSELDFCDTIKAREMQKALCRLNLGIWYQFWPAPQACLAFPLSLTPPISSLSSLPCSTRPPNRYPYFCHPDLSVPCCLVYRTCKPHRPLSPLTACLMDTYSFLHGVLKSTWITLNREDTTHK